MKLLQKNKENISNSIYIEPLTPSEIGSIIRKNREKERMVMTNQ